MTGHQDPRLTKGEEEEERLLRRAVATGDVTGWFGDLHAAAATVASRSPGTHPLLAAWAAARLLDGSGRTAVVVGCAAGADAEYLADLGFDTTVFDVASTVIELARRRNPHAHVQYRTADILNPPAEWRHGFDLVVEIITVQALPTSHQRRRSPTSGAWSLAGARCSSSLGSTTAGREPGYPSPTRSTDPGSAPSPWTGWWSARSKTGQSPVKPNSGDGWPISRARPGKRSP